MTLALVPATSFSAPVPDEIVVSTGKPSTAEVTRAIYSVGFVKPYKHATISLEKEISKKGNAFRLSKFEVIYGEKDLTLQFPKDIASRIVRPRIDDIEIATPQYSRRMKSPAYLIVFVPFGEIGPVEICGKPEMQVYGPRHLLVATFSDQAPIEYKIRSNCATGWNAVEESE